jgi:hypothetical protein
MCELSVDDRGGGANMLMEAGLEGRCMGLLKKKIGVGGA